MIIEHFKEIFKGPEIVHVVVLALLVQQINEALTDIQFTIAIAHNVLPKGLYSLDVAGFDANLIGGETHRQTGFFLMFRQHAKHAFALDSIAINSLVNDHRMTVSKVFLFQS